MTTLQYISNPIISNDTGKIGLVSFEKPFIFSTIVNKDKNIDLTFSITDENINDLISFKISNINFIDFTLSDDKKYIYSKKFVNENKVECFNETFIIKNNSLYKKVITEDSPQEKWVDYFYEGEDIYAESESSIFELISDTDGFFIKKNIVINDKITELLEMSLYIGDELLYNNTMENEQIFLGDKFECRFVIIDGKTLSFLAKNKDMETYKKMKAFSFPKRLSQGGIKISVDESMKLDQLSFSFLKADI